MATRAEKSAREVVRVFRIVLGLEEQLVAAHAEDDWDKAIEVAARLRRAVKASKGMVDKFADHLKC
jgi:lipopolysaccharide biosynthesis regulator YciM